MVAKFGLASAMLGVFFLALTMGCSTAATKKGSADIGGGCPMTFSQMDYENSIAITPTLVQKEGFVVRKDKLGKKFSVPILRPTVGDGTPTGEAVAKDLWTTDCDVILRPSKYLEWEGCDKIDIIEYDARMSLSRNRDKYLMSIANPNSPIISVSLDPVIDPFSNTVYWLKGEDSPRSHTYYVLLANNRLGEEEEPPRIGKYFFVEAFVNRGSCESSKPDARDVFQETCNTENCDALPIVEEDVGGGHEPPRKPTLTESRK